MAKKLSASSRPAKQIRVSAESIWINPLGERLQQFGAGYSTRINKVLRAVMVQGRPT